MARTVRHRMGATVRLLLAFAVALTASPLASFGAAEAAALEPVFTPVKTWPAVSEPFWSPSGVAVDSNAGMLYTVDSARHRVVKHAFDGTLVTAWGSFGTASGQLISPKGIAVGPDGYVYVADTGNDRIQVFSSTGEFLRTWGTTGVGDGRFNRPSAIAVYGTDVYVSDTENHRIQKFNTYGDFLLKFGVPNDPGNGGFISPMGIAVDGTYVYVADTGNSRVQRFTTGGAYNWQWGTAEVSGVTSSRFTQPTGIAVDSEGRIWVTKASQDTRNGYVYQFERSPNTGARDATFATFAVWGQKDAQVREPSGIAVATNGMVFVADTGNSRVQVWQNGAFVRSIGADGAEAGRLRVPRSVASDADGNYYVTDSLNDRVQKFGPDGTFLLQWDGTGSGLAFKDPSGITVDEDGTVWVVDSGNARVVSFSASGDFLATWSTRIGGEAPGTPRGIDVHAGNVYLTDITYDRVQVHNTAEGALVRQFGSTGTGVDQFIDPNDIAVVEITATDFELFIADTGNHRVRFFSPNGVHSHSLGEIGIGPGQFWRPMGVGVHTTKTLNGPYENRYYVADTANERVQELGSNQLYSGMGGSIGVDPGCYRGPVDVVVDADGKPVVLEMDNHRLQRAAIDREAPNTSITLTPNTGGVWTSSSVVVSMAAGDDVSGVDRTFYRINGGETTTYTAPFTMSQDGDFILEYWSRDKAGHVKSPAPFAPVRIDKTKPVTSSNITSGSAYGLGHKVVLTADDAMSGVAEVRYRINGGAFQDYVEPFPVTDEGTKTIEFQARDEAGNWENLQARVAAFKDPIPRTVSNIDGAWQSTDVTVTLSASSAIPDNLQTFYRLGNGAVTTYTVPFKVSTEGATQVAFWSSVVGGVEGTNTATIRIDKSAPVVSTLLADTTYLGSVTATFSASDGAGSGLNYIEYRWGTDGIWTRYDAPVFTEEIKQHVLQVRAVDRLNNASTPLTKTFSVTLPVPKTTSSIDGVWRADYVSVSLTVDSFDPRRTTTFYRLAGKDATYTAPFTVKDEGVIPVEFWSKVPGAEEIHQTAYVRIDRTQPTTQRNRTDNSYRGTTFALFGSDPGGSGVAVTQYRIGDVGPYATYTRPFTITRTGTTTVWYRSIDAAGNVESIHREDVKIPAPPVTITSLRSPTHPYPWRVYRSRSPKFTWTGSAGTKAYRWVIDRRTSTVPVGRRVSTARYARYYNLRSGTWYFHVQARNADGVWGRTRHIKIRIR